MGGGISNSKVITEEGKCSLDAIQNNPNVEGTLAYEIQELKTTSPIVIKDFYVENVVIDVRNGEAIYYGYINNFFADNDITVNKVISVTIRNWTGANYMFSTFVYTDDGRLGFASPASQTIDGIMLRVVYLK